VIQVYQNAATTKIISGGDAAAGQGFSRRAPLSEGHAGPRIARTPAEIEHCINKAVAGMETRDPDWNKDGKFPEFPAWRLNWHNKVQEQKYVRMWMEDIGLDRIIGFANRRPESADAEKAHEAIERCAHKYPRASISALYFIQESYVLAAMSLARDRFREMGKPDLAASTFRAMDRMRSKSADEPRLRDMKPDGSHLKVCD
jgi:hypothetical protein